MRHASNEAPSIAQTSRKRPSNNGQTTAQQAIPGAIQKDKKKGGIGYKPPGPPTPERTVCMVPTPRRFFQFEVWCDRSSGVRARRVERCRATWNPAFLASMKLAFSAEEMGQLGFFMGRLEGEQSTPARGGHPWPVKEGVIKAFVRGLCIAAAIPNYSFKRLLSDEADSSHHGKIWGACHPFSIRKIRKCHRFPSSGNGTFRERRDRHPRGHVVSVDWNGLLIP